MRVTGALGLCASRMPREPSAGPIFRPLADLKYPSDRRSGPGHSWVSRQQTTRLRDRKTNCLPNCRSPEETARTIAHELNHARSFLRGGSAPESAAYGAEGYLWEWMAGGR